MRASIFTIGSEIVEGSILDTNATYLGKQLSALGIKCTEILSVADNKPLIVKSFKHLIKENDLIITSGGLGPTFDDITYECLAEALEVRLLRDEKTLTEIKKYVESNGRVFDINTHGRMSFFPQGTETLPNGYGLALGGHITLPENKHIYILPGVPGELYNIYEEHIHPYLANIFKLNKSCNKELLFLGTVESTVNKIIMDNNLTNRCEIILNASASKVVVRLRGEEQEVNAVASILREDANIREYFFGYEERLPAKVLYDICKDKNIKVAFAESCTGGFISKLLTDIPGVSEIFYGSIISYDDKAKTQELGVEERVLREYGAVSKEAASQMSRALIEREGVDVGLSITGIAGPSGGTLEKSVGTVVISIVGKKGKRVEFLEKFRGNRDSIRIASSSRALYLMIDFINKNY